MLDKWFSTPLSSESSVLSKNQCVNSLNNFVFAWRSAFSSFSLMVRSVIKKLATAKNLSVVLVNHFRPEELPECLEKCIGTCVKKACNEISL
jgi:hypothetical protein